MPPFGSERFFELATRFVSERGAPWPSPPSIETNERTIRHCDDEHARQTTWRAVDGKRVITVVQLVWRELDSNGTSTEVETEGTLQGSPDGGALEVRGGRSFTTFRVVNSASLEAAWIDFCSRVFREGLVWYEHPAIPAAWLRSVRGVDILAETRDSYEEGLVPGYLLFQDLRELVRDAVPWLIYGPVNLEARRAPMLVLGPVPKDRKVSCRISAQPPRNVDLFEIDAETIASCVCGPGRWALEHDSTRVVPLGGSYGMVDVQRAGNKPGDARAGDERCRIWRRGDWVMRSSELRSDTFADCFTLVVQHERGDGTALFANGVGPRRPHGCWQPSSTAQLHMRLLGPGKDAMQTIATSLDQYIEDHGWKVEPQYWTGLPYETPAMRERVRPWPFPLTEAERTEMDALAKQLGDAIRAGATFWERNREEADECKCEGGKLVWTCWWQDKENGRYELETDEDLAKQLLLDSYADGAVGTALEGLVRLRAAVRSVKGR